MKVTSKKQSGIITFDGKGTQVIRAVPNGTVTYRVKYDLDLIKAVQSGVASVQITVKRNPSSNETDQTIVSDVGSMTPENVISSLRKSSANKKKAKRARDGLVVKMKKSDFTKKISNEVASKIVNVDRKTAESLMGTVKTVSLISGRDVNKSGKDVPVLQVPLDIQGAGQGNERSYRESAHDLILRGGVSPTSIGDFTSAFISSEEAVAGVTPRKKSTGYGSSKRTSDSTVQSLYTKFVGANVDIKHSGEITNLKSTSIPVLSFEQHGTPVSEMISLSSSEIATLGNDFTIEVAAIDQNGSILDTAECVVDHYDEVTSSSPTTHGLVTNFKGFLSGGDNTSVDDLVDEELVDDDDVNIYGPNGWNVDDQQEFNDLQNAITDSAVQEGLQEADQLSGMFDDISDVFDIYGRTSGPFIPDTETDYTYMGQMTSGLGYDFVAQQYTDSGMLNGYDVGKTMIQANVAQYSYSQGSTIRYVTRGSMSSDFTDIVLPSQMRSMSSANFLLGPTSLPEIDKRFSSITGLVSKDGINIEVSGISIPCSVMLVRRDLTLHEQQSMMLDLASQLSTGDGATISFKDANVKEDHVYEYKAKIVTRKGRDVLTSGVCLVKFFEANDNALTVDVTSPQVLIDDTGEIDVKFGISATVPETGVSAITSILAERGLTNFFETEIQNQREELQNLVTFQIERHDLTMGIVESFGVFTGSSFSDKSNRKTNNVTRLRPNRKYRYVVSILMRSTETLLPTVTRTQVDDTTKKSYTFTPAKYLHPTTLKSGVLKSNASFSSTANVDLENEFNAGFIGIQKIIDVSTILSKAKITFSNVSVNSKGCNKVSWKVKGSTSDIDHFVILGEQLGMKTIVGKVHNITHNGTYEHVDKKLSRNVGDVKYSVVPVFKDFTVGKVTEAGTKQAKSVTKIKK